MATWGAYLASYTKKKEETPQVGEDVKIPPKDWSSTKATIKLAPPNVVTKKLYSIPTEPVPKNAFQRSDSNAARLAKMFENATPALVQAGTVQDIVVEQNFDAKIPPAAKTRKAPNLSVALSSLDRLLALEEPVAEVPVAPPRKKPIPPWEKPVAQIPIIQEIPTAQIREVQEKPVAPRAVIQEKPAAPKAVVQEKPVAQNPIALGMANTLKGVTGALPVFRARGASASSSIKPKKIEDVIQVQKGQEEDKTIEKTISEYMKEAERIQMQRERMDAERKRILEEQARIQKEADRFAEEEEQMRKVVENLKREGERDLENTENREKRRRMEEERQRKERELEEEENRQKEEEKRRKEDEQRRQAEEQRWKEEEQRRQADEQRRKDDDAARLQAARQNNANKYEDPSMQNVKRSAVSEDERLAKEEAGRLTAELQRYEQLARRAEDEVREAKRAEEERVAKQQKAMKERAEKMRFEAEERMQKEREKRVRVVQEEEQKMRNAEKSRLQLKEDESLRYEKKLKDEEAERVSSDKQARMRREQEQRTRREMDERLQYAKSRRGQEEKLRYNEDQRPQYEAAKEEPEIVDKEEEIRKAEAKIRAAFAGLSQERGQLGGSSQTQQQQDNASTKLRKGVKPAERGLRVDREDEAVNSERGISRYNTVAARPQIPAQNKPLGVSRGNTVGSRPTALLGLPNGPRSVGLPVGPRAGLPAGPRPTART